MELKRKDTPLILKGEKKVKKQTYHSSGKARESIDYGRKDIVRKDSCWFVSDEN